MCESLSIQMETSLIGELSMAGVFKGQQENFKYKQTQKMNSLKKCHF